MTKGPKPKPMPERFWNKINKTPTCWEWVGCKSPEGYGKIASRRRNYPEIAHRLSWELHFGEIPSGLLVLHRCDNPCCVNPAHLFIGTHADNAQDMVKKGRCNRKHLTKEQKHEIRSLFKFHKASYAELGIRFGVTAATIHNVVCKKCNNIR